MDIIKQEFKEYYEQYHDNGFVIIPQLMAEHLAYLQTIDNIILNQLKKPLRTTNGLQNDVPQCKNLMFTPKLYQFMCMLVGGKALGVDAQYFFGQPQIKGFNVHQDNFYAQSPFGCYASAWLAIDNACPENGCVYAYPGTHKMPTLPVVDTGYEIDNTQIHTARAIQVDYDFSQLPKVDVSIKGGDVLFIHGNVFHSSNKNITRNSTRRSLLFTYIKQGVYIRSGQSVKREPFYQEYVA